MIVRARDKHHDEVRYEQLFLVEWKGKLGGLPLPHESGGCYSLNAVYYSEEEGWCLSPDPIGPVFYPRDIQELFEKGEVTLSLFISGQVTARVFTL